MSWDPCTICRVETRRARKEHRCSQCEGTIAAGEPYAIYHTLFEGAWHDYKQCIDCEHMISDICRGLRDDEGPAFEGLLEDVMDGDDIEIKTRMLEIMRRRKSPEKAKQALERNIGCE